MYVSFILFFLLFDSHTIYSTGSDFIFLPHLLQYNFLLTMLYAVRTYIHTLCICGTGTGTVHCLSRREELSWQEKNGVATKSFRFPGENRVMENSLWHKVQLSRAAAVTLEELHENTICFAMVIHLKRLLRKLKSGWTEESELYLKCFGNIGKCFSVNLCTIRFEVRSPSQCILDKHSRGLHFNCCEGKYPAGMKYEATDNIMRPPTPLIRHSKSQGNDDIGDNQFLKNVKPISAFERYMGKMKNLLWSFLFTSVVFKYPKMWLCTFYNIINFFIIITKLLYLHCINFTFRINTGNYVIWYLYFVFVFRFSIKTLKTIRTSGLLTLSFSD